MASAQLEDFQVHLRDVQNEPSIPLDIKLLDRCELYLTSATTAEVSIKTREQIFFQIAQLLPSLQQDPKPLTPVIIKLSGPLSFDLIAQLDLLPALDLAAKPLHAVALDLLEKATSSPSYVEILAGKPDLIAALVTVWLCTDDAGIASKAGQLLVDFLKLSKNVPEPLQSDTPTVYGNGPMWKRIFGDKDIFRLFFAVCSHRQGTGPLLDLSKNQKTLAQARLMDWLPRVGVLDWDTLIRCHHVDVVTEYGLETGQGLLTFAAEVMVDFEDDILMHINLINFYATLISTVKKDVSGNMSVSLQYLITRHLHNRTMSYWIFPDASNPLESSYLSGPSAQYIATYASTYPEHFEASSLTELFTALRSTLDISLARWSANQPPSSGLQILASLPRTSLYPADASNRNFSASPLSLIPTKNTAPAALHTLASIFHGPPIPRPSLVQDFPPPTATEPLNITISEARYLVEREAAAGLFWLYLAANPTLFTDLVRQADIVALADRALAALSFLHALATANWNPDPLPSTPDDSITASSDAAANALARVVTVAKANPNLPRSGIGALLHPPVRNVVFPYLLKPPVVFANLVGGLGDPESAAYRIAMAKYDLVKLVHDGLEGLAAKNPQAKEWTALAGALKERLAEGPLGAGASGAGGQVATVDM